MSDLAESGAPRPPFFRKSPREKREPRAAEAAHVTVVMPTFKQASFIQRAIESLIAQSFTAWQLIIVDDGSPDDTLGVVSRYLDDPRIRYHRLARNRGLGHALNVGIGLACTELIAYLPSDDVYYADHLATLVPALESAPEAALGFSGVRHHYNRFASGIIEGGVLQLVQVLQRRGLDRWIEREELTTDDLDRMLWAALRQRGAVVRTGHVTCEWVDHPLQRHKIIQEGETSGQNAYRSYYGVTEPLRFQSSIGNYVDEVAYFARFRDQPRRSVTADGLKILLVGELAYNPERILALEERGHQLFGLWTPIPAGFNTVGPLPFGQVTDLPSDDWQAAVRSIRPDIIYALLNWQAVPFAHHVLTENPGIPFVWHFKEGPFICLQKGTWPQLMELHTQSDGRIYSSPELRRWFETIVPEAAGAQPTLVLDGDLPKQEWFARAPSRRISAADGEIHTVVPGRPIGLHPHTVGELAAHGIHLHFYGDLTHHLWSGWIETTSKLAPGYLHLHSQVDQRGWVSEFSKYDAGWLHIFKSENAGELRRANWDDLNYPARIATLVAAGLPLIQFDNRHAVVATQALSKALDIGVFFTDIPHLGVQLRNESLLARVRHNVGRHRSQFTFDHHVDDLVGFFRQVIDHRSVPRS